MRAAWVLAGCLLLGACASPGGGMIPETPFMGRPLALRPGTQEAIEQIAALEIKEDWRGLAALAEPRVPLRPGGDDDWLMVLGYARMRAGDFPKAIEAFQRVSDRVPEDPDSRNLLGESLRLSGQVDRAIQVLERSVQAHPNSHNGWYLLGEAYVAHNRLERARSAYSESVRIEPQFATGWYGLAAVLARVGPRDEYEAVLQRLKETRPDMLDAHLKAVAGRGR